MNPFSKVFLNKRFFILLGGVVVVFVFGFFFDILFVVARFLLLGLVLVSLADLVLIFSNPKSIQGERSLSDRLSNAESNEITISLLNYFKFPVRLKIFEELPFQFDEKKFELNTKVKPGHEKSISYTLKPLERGVYNFGNTVVFALSPLGIWQRRIVLPTAKEIRVFPSFLRLNQYTLKNFKQFTNMQGQKKMRRLGHSMEFEQIKGYVTGDDIRKLNWKATAKRGELMINHHVDERAQQVYCAIDKGRVMQMTFNGLTLLDYAVNASLVVSNIVLENQDRAGIFGFSNRIENFLPAERRNNQMRKVSETLYAIDTDFKESDFGKLFGLMRKRISHRSLILLFTNFESHDAMERHLPYLRAINQSHVLVLIMFQNADLKKFAEGESPNNEFERVLAEKFIYEKVLIQKELQHYGIQTILTEPENLKIATINKYLDLKAEGVV